MGLQITRTVGQGLMIGDEIRIMVYRSKNGSLAMNIEAPKYLKVHRLEVYEQLKGKEYKDRKLPEPKNKREENIQKPAIILNPAPVKKLDSYVPRKGKI